MNWVNRTVRGNLIIVAFGLLAIYTFTKGNVLEGVVYVLVALGFTLMEMVKSERFSAYKRPLNIASWIVILGAVLLFIALLRQDAYGF